MQRLIKLRPTLKKLGFGLGLLSFSAITYHYAYNRKEFSEEHPSNQQESIYHTNDTTNPLDKIIEEKAEEKVREAGNFESEGQVDENKSLPDSSGLADGIGDKSNENIDNIPKEELLESASIETSKDSEKQPIEEQQILSKEMVSEEEKQLEEKGVETAQNTKTAKYNFASINEIPQFDLTKELEKDDFMLIIIDLPYTPTFEKEILAKMQNTIKKRKSNTPLQIYRVNPLVAENKELLQNKYGAEIREETVLLLKNPYEKKLINVDFDIYIQHSSLPSVMLSQLKIIDNINILSEEVNRMSANDTFLLYTADIENDGDIDGRKLMAKYIEMELSVNHIENIKVFMVDEKLMKEQGIISEGAKPNSLHLIRRSNEFTFKEGNRKLNGEPFHVIESINFYDKSRNIMIPRHLSKVETFNSVKVDAPYVCSLTLDRNRLSPKEERQILNVFAQLKKKEEFSNVSFVLRFGETEFRGSDEDKFANKKFSLILGNLEEIEKQIMVHEIKNKEDAKMLGISEDKWLRDSFEYLYKEPEITVEGVSQFIGKSLRGEEPQYYKSEQKEKLQKLTKVTGNTFNKIIFNEDPSLPPKSHLVFEYSDHCVACQALSPAIDHFSSICKQFESAGLEINSLNSDKNKVKGQLYTPYTPNLNYFSKTWKNKIPIKYPVIEYINKTGIWGIYDFCTITDSLSAVDLSKFEEHIKNHTQNKVRISDF